MFSASFSKRFTSAPRALATVLVLLAGRTEAQSRGQELPARAPAADSSPEGTVAGGAPNPTCETATEIFGTGTFQFDVTGFGLGDSAPGGWLLDDVWYRWTATASGSIVVTSQGYTEHSTKIFVYGSGSCGTTTIVGSTSGLPPMACRAPVSLTQDTVSFVAAEGSIYLIRIGKPADVNERGGTGLFHIKSGEPYDYEVSESQFAGPHCASDRCQGPVDVAASESTPAGTQAADAFRMLSEESFDGLLWWGGYLQGERDGFIDSIDSFTVTYFADDGGRPGTVVAGPFSQSEGTLVVRRIAARNDQVLGTARLVEYRGDHAEVALPTDVDHWLVITNAANDGRVWYWQDGRRGDEASLVRPSGADWSAATLSAGDMSFCLRRPFESPPNAMPAPGNDACENAQLVIDGDTPFANLGATTDGVLEENEGEDDKCPLSPGDRQTYRDIWFEHAASCTGELVAEVVEADFDARVLLYRDALCSDATSDACDDGRPGSSGEPLARLSVTEGETVRIRVGSSGDRNPSDCTSAWQCFNRPCLDRVRAFRPSCDRDENWSWDCADLAVDLCRGHFGSGTLRLTCIDPPAVEACAQPHPLAIPGGLNVLIDGAAPDCDLLPGWNEWATFELEETATLTLHVAYDAADARPATMLARECPCDSLLGATDANYAIDGSAEFTFECVVPGTYFYPLVAGAGGAPRNVEVTALEEACGNACANANAPCCTEHGLSGCRDESCCETICAIDPYCCDTRWDRLCAFAASRLCPDCPNFACSTATHDCQSTSVAPGCDDPDVCEVICGCDPACCIAGWDEQCVGTFFPVVPGCAANFDCNENGIPDISEVVNGLVSDCGGDLIPDECQPDCNQNGVEDSCDIRDGTSLDCVRDGVPDECEADCVSAGFPFDCAWTEVPGADCEGNGIEDACEVALGLVSDCNENEIGDSCEITDSSPRRTLVYDTFDSGAPDPTIWTDFDGAIVEDPAGEREGLVAQVDLLRTREFDLREWESAAVRLLGRVADDPGAGVIQVSWISSEGSFVLWSVSGTEWATPFATIFRLTGWTETPDRVGYVEIRSTTPGALHFIDTFEIRVATPDCNMNGVPDECEFGTEGPPDCDENGVPDLCDVLDGRGTDCDENGALDDCELASNPDLDCDGNGTADACDIDVNPNLDCDDNGALDACELEADPGLDCNGNGTFDACDIVAGTSFDCQGNLVPDECETDCNKNGIDDACDIVDGTALDCQLNGVPDVCDLEAGTETDCDADLVPDRCQIVEDSERDCDHNGVLDTCDLVAESDTDCNGNGRLDGCDLDTDPALDCDGNGEFDACEINDGVLGDCDGNGIPDSCEIDFDPALDCNQNMTLDACDIADGIEDDCDENDIPDDCELSQNDCNSNGVLDGCEIAADPSLDCDASGIPDICELSQGDCDSSGVLDRCEIASEPALDCDENGLLDACELESGLAPDCNRNDRLDTCDREDLIDLFYDPVESLLDLSQWTPVGSIFVFGGKIEMDSSEILVSRTIPLFGTLNPRILFELEEEADPTDTLAVEWAIGEGWNRLATLTGETPDRQVAMIELPLPPEALSSDFVFRFVASTDASFDDFLIDEIRVTIGSDDNQDGVLDACAARGDFDGDGEVTLEDWGYAINCLRGPRTAVESACIPVDVNGDSATDLRDVAAIGAATAYPVP